MMRGFGGFDGFGGHMGGYGAAKGFGYGALSTKELWIGLLVGAVLKLILFAAIAYLVYRLVKNHRKIQGNTEPAMAILRERYAKGEITEEDFIQRKELLIK